MKKLAYLLSVLLLFSCAENELGTEDEAIVASSQRRQAVVVDGVVYPSTSPDAQTRISYNDTDVDWVNGTQVTLPNGENVDLPWVDGGSLPFYMQEKLSPDNGWELVAHTMRPDTQSDRSYLIFHNYITGTLRVFCYVSTFATNNNGYWKLTLSQPGSLFNFTGKYALPMNVNGSSEIVVSNSTTQLSKGFAKGWNGFQVELAYDPDASGILKIEPMNINASGIVMDGDFAAETEGTIIGKSSAPSATSQLISAIGKLAGDAVEDWLEDTAPEVEENVQAPQTRLATGTIISMAKAGVTAVFSMFSGLFNKQTQKVYDVNLTTHGNVTLSGAITTPTPAPIVPLNLHLDMIDGALGGWNLEEAPSMTWWNTIINDTGVNSSVTDRVYHYTVSQPQSLDYTVRTNPKSHISSSGWSYWNKRFVRSSELPLYAVTEGDVPFDYTVLPTYIVKYQYDDIDVIEQLVMQINVRYPEYSTYLDAPSVIYLEDEENYNRIVEYTNMHQPQSMDFYLQLSTDQDIVINGVTNEYISSRLFQCPKHYWGSEY